MTKATLLPLLLLVFILLDTGYSFLQHRSMALDGDMAGIVLPGEHYRQVLQDPFGLSVLQGERYGAPNRFFVHWAMSVYFKNMPLWFQHFVSPIDSIYWACALFKTMLQLLLIGMLAAFIGKGLCAERRGWLLAAALVVPMFQAFGYSLQMGIIEKSITYTFFYPFTLALLLCFLLPFYPGSGQRNFRWWQHLLLLPLSVILPFSGPLIPPLLMMICPSVLVLKYLALLGRQPTAPLVQRAKAALREMPKAMLFYFPFISLLAFWSFYVGTFNIENDGTTVPLASRYMALTEGLFSLLKQKLGLPLLLCGAVINVRLVSKNAPPAERSKFFTIGKWLLVFTALYLLLLPLGGYRGYRPLVIRHDTIMPVVLALVYFYGLTSFYLLRKLDWRYKHLYKWGILAVALIFTIADVHDFHHNACEKAALRSIAQSKEKVVALQNPCNILSWSEITDPRDSGLNAQMLKAWGVTEEARLYFSKK